MVLKLNSMRDVENFILDKIENSSHLINACTYESLHHVLMAYIENRCNTIKITFDICESAYKVQKIDKKDIRLSITICTICTYIGFFKDFYTQMTTSISYITYIKSNGCQIS